MRTYIGARYVPLIVGEWSNSAAYEPLSIVTNKGNSFTSKKAVPVGIDITNTEYWASTGNYNAQVESYRQEVVALGNKFDTKISWFDNIDDLRAADDIGTGMVATKGYYFENDGGEGFYYVRDKKEGDIDNGGSVIIAGNKACLLMGRTISVKQFGAKGDGITDDYEAISKCFNYSNEVIIPSGDYMISQGLTFLDGKLTCYGRLKTVNAITALTIGTETALTKNVEVINPSVLGSNVDNQVGIKIVNVSNSIFKKMQAEQCNTGILIEGVGFGTINNAFDFGKVLQCYRGVRVHADNAGWVNQNIFTDADVQNYSSDNRDYIKLLFESGENVINGNTFIGFNLEGHSDTSKAIYGTCAHCVFLNCRFESTGAGSIELTGQSDYNSFINPTIFPLNEEVYVMPDTNYSINPQSITAPAYGFCYKPSADRNEIAFSTRPYGSDFSFAALTSYIRSTGDSMFNSVKCNNNLSFRSGFMTGRDGSPEGQQLGYKGCLCLSTGEADFGLYLKTTGTPEELSNTGWVKLNT